MAPATRQTIRLSTVAAVGVLVAPLLVLTTVGAQTPPDTCLGLEVTQLGTDGDDVIVGTAGDDIIQAGPGDDIVRGLGGSDTICGGPGADIIRGGTGRDALFGQGGPDRVVGNRGGDRVDGGPGDDTLIGGLGHDNLVGRRGADTVLPGSGIDRLAGGPGWDDCYPGITDVDRRIRCEEKVIAEADGPLAGVAIGARPVQAIRQMRRAFGPPTENEGWEVGCPLDGFERNERHVSWGSLQATFYGLTGEREFIGWSYRPFEGQPDPGGPLFSDVLLPGGVSIGDPISDAAIALGVDLEPGILDEGLRAVAPGGGLQIWTLFEEPTAPIQSVFVAGFLTCE